MRSLAEWLARLEAVHPKSIDLGLERVRVVAQTLHLERPGVPTWIVGGTNGKGSTVAFLDSMLRAAGRSVGTFTSPHLIRYNERIRIDGELATDVELVEAIEAIDAARGDVSLTFFEFNALAALHVFRARSVSAIVLEVGLGGRLDATNLVDADVAVLCSIGFDHRDWLGETLEEIGREKAGIFRAGRPVVLGDIDMPSTVFEAMARLGVQGWYAARDFEVVREADSAQGTWTYRMPHAVGKIAPREFHSLPRPALLGEVQYANAAAAISALLAGGVDVQRGHVVAGLTSVRWPGRFQIVPGDVEWILDVAHNEPAANSLARNLAERKVSGRTLAVAGFLEDKDVHAIARALDDSIDAWILASTQGPRGLEADAVAVRLDAGANVLSRQPNVQAACEYARAHARPGDRVVVFGSFLIVGPALEWLGLY